MLAIIAMAGLAMGIDEPPLHSAARNSDMITAKRLVAENADINGKDPNWGNTPLHLAVYTGLRDMANLFLAHGADVNAKDSNGWTPLHWAAHHSKYDMAELLVAHGSTTTVEDNAGYSPRQRASDTDAFDVAVEAGRIYASLNDKGNDQKPGTPKAVPAEEAFSDEL